MEIYKKLGNFFKNPVYPDEKLVITLRFVHYYLY